jgi:hypothetical protein
VGCLNFYFFVDFSVPLCRQLFIYIIMTFEPVIESFVQIVSLRSFVHSLTLFVKFLSKLESLMLLEFLGSLNRHILLKISPGAAWHSVIFIAAV